MASGNKLAIGNTLNESLRNLVSQYAVNIEVENTDNVDDLIDAIIRANDNLEESTSNANYEMMGKDIQRLQELIKQLETVVEEEREENEQNQTNEIVPDGNLVDSNVVANVVS